MYANNHGRDRSGRRGRLCRPAAFLAKSLARRLVRLRLRARPSSTSCARRAPAASRRACARPRSASGPRRGGARAVACWRECRRPSRPESTTPALAWAPRRPAPGRRGRCGGDSSGRRSGGRRHSAPLLVRLQEPALLAALLLLRLLAHFHLHPLGPRCAALATLLAHREIDETTLLAGPAAFPHVLLRAVVGARALAAGRAALHRLGRAAVRLGRASGCRGLLVAAVPLWSLAGLLASIDLLLLLDGGAAFLGAARHGLSGAVLHRGDVRRATTLRTARCPPDSPGAQAQTTSLTRQSHVLIAHRSTSVHHAPYTKLIPAPPAPHRCADAAATPPRRSPAPPSPTAPPRGASPRCATRGGGGGSRRGRGRGSSACGTS